MHSFWLKDQGELHQVKQETHQLQIVLRQALEQVETDAQQTLAQLDQIAQGASQQVAAALAATQADAGRLQQLIWSQQTPQAEKDREILSRLEQLERQGRLP